MPKTVDHAARRRAIVEVAWTVIAERGLEATGMRDLARECGFANGALSHYFPSKGDLLRAAWEHVFERTNDRVATSTAGLRGLDALEQFCKQVLPMTPSAQAEAKVVLNFWQRALSHPDLAEINDTAMATWRAFIRRCLHEAQTDGAVTTSADFDIEVAIEELLAMLMGAQMLAILTPDAHTPLLQERMIAAALQRHVRTPVSTVN
ncbi:TetR/AcrR family transcriptional regulator [Rhodococcus indonesiensis]